jgi:hypothetical protein
MFYHKRGFHLKRKLNLCFRLKRRTLFVAPLRVAVEDEGGIGELLFWQAEAGAKENLGRPASGQSHESHAFFEVALGGKKVQSFLDRGPGSSGMRLDWLRWMRS